MVRKRTADPSHGTPHQTAERFYAEILSSLGLSSEEIRRQSLDELNSSLELIEELLAHGNTLGSVKAGESPAMTLEFGAAPFLLRRKREIEKALSSKVRPISLEYPNLDATIKASGITGAVFFAVLYLSYYTFYSTVGIQPEDVGVNYAFVLARSFGLAAVALLVVAFVAYGGLIDDRLAKVFRREEQHSPSKAEMISSLLSYGSCVLVVSLLWINEDFVFHWLRNAATALVVALLPWIYMIVRRRRLFETRTYYFLFSAALVFSYAVGLTTYSGMKAREALDGHAVSPAEVLGIPLWDIEAPYVTVQWTGPRDQRPAEFKETRLPCAIRLGRNTTTVFLIVPGSRTEPATYGLLEVPAGMVSIDKRFAQARCPAGTEASSEAGGS